LLKHKNKFILDTNFIISAFEKNPSTINIFIKKIRSLNIQLLITNHIIKEVRWYLRRRIINEITIKEVSTKEIRKLLSEIEKKGISPPHFPDLSNIVLARKLEGTVVTSDLQLLKTCEELGVPVHMSSSFVFFLKEKVNNFEDKKFFNELYDIILSDEIMHSVEQSETYNPVYRIKEIQLHAIKVLQNLPKISPNKTQEMFFLKEENELLDLINEIEFEMPNYITQIRDGTDLETLEVELKDIYNQINDIVWQLQLQLKTRKSLILSASIRIKARILFALSIVEFTLLNFGKLENTLNILSEIVSSSPDMVSDLFMDLQFLRMVFLFVTQNYNRLTGYFSDNFLLLCEIEKRKDLTKLTRTIIFACTILESRVIDKNASLEGKKEISLLFQLGYILLQKRNIENALLILLQTHYLALQIKDEELIRNSLELMIVVHYISNENISTEIEKGIIELKKLNPFNVPVFSIKEEFDLNIFTNTEFKPIDEFPSLLKEWFYIYDYLIKEEEGQTKTAIFVISPYFSPKTVFITTQSLPMYELRPGRQIKIIKGMLKIRKCSYNYEKREVDLVIEIKEPLFSLRDPWGMKIIR